MMSAEEHRRRVQHAIDLTVQEKADEWAARLGCSRDEVIAATPRAAAPQPRALLPEASALWLAPGTPARPLSFAEGAVMLWRLREWERRVKAWWNAIGTYP